MFKITTLMIALSTALMLPLTAQASDTREPARICLSKANMGTDGVDELQRKLARQRGEQAECVPARVVLSAANDGTDGVDRFQARLARQAGQSEPANALGTQGRVYLSAGTDGTDGVDRFQRRISGS